MEIFDGVAVERRQIPDYFTDEFTELLSAWSQTRKFGMPFAGGWAEQPCRLMDVLKDFERMFAKWESEK